jgi:hypothetical protein
MKEDDVILPVTCADNLHISWPWIFAAVVYRITLAFVNKFRVFHRFSKHRS